MNIVLVQPEIPQNTGNIARTCAVTGQTLHLVGPLGFSLEDRFLKRAGLDYWSLLDIHVYDTMELFWEKNHVESLYLLSTKGKKGYAQVTYSDKDYLFFGPETRGLSAEFIQEHMERTIRIPMKQDARSINLSNSVAIVLYEALRQQDFRGLC